MTIALVTRRDAAARAGGRWDAWAFHLLVAAGAATVIAGSYLPWATFYGGLVARDGVAGHGRYFIGIAAACVALALATTRPGVWRGLRWLLLPAGLAIVAVALRDLRNLSALTHDPAAGFYLPGRGPGLFVVFGGGLALALAAPLAATRGGARGHADPWRTLAMLAAAVALALAVPGLYGEYYARLAPGHLPGRGGALSDSGLLTVAAGLTALVTTQLLLLSLARRPRARSAAATAPASATELRAASLDRRRRRQRDAAGGVRSGGGGGL